MDPYKFKLHCQNLVSLLGRQSVSEVTQVIFARILINDIYDLKKLGSVEMSVLLIGT
jgi:hypothetical protein